MWADLVLLSPGWLKLLFVLPVLAVPVLFARGGRALLAALLLRTLAFVLVVLALAGLSVEREEASRGLCIVVAADASDSVGSEGGRRGEELLRGLADRLAPGDEIGAVAFARQAQVLAFPAWPPRIPTFAAAKLDTSATRLAAGIESSVPLCPDDRERKVVLVTDGNETVGDARRAAAFARQIGVRLYADIPGARGDAALSFEKLIAPPLVREGSMFPLRAMVRSLFPVPAEGALEILVNGELAAREPVRFDPGVNVFEVPYRLHERGSYRLAARVVTDEAAGEERREVSLAVAGPIRALVMGGGADRALSKALELKDVDVEFREPAAVPKLEDLIQYHCVILDDVPRKQLSEEVLETLESYVKNFGGGLLMTGGPRSFGDKGFQKSALERVLPVSLIERQPKPKGRSGMGLFLLIDRSNSMSENSRRSDVRDGENMRYARQAARALIDQLRDEDRVGVIAFDSDPYVLGPLRPLSEHRGELADRISRLQPGGGTDFKAALEIATAQLGASNLKVLHVILLTDGDTNRNAEDHVSVIQALARLGISVTTIRIGTNDVNLEFLQGISRQTGGRFYHVDDIEKLPQLVVSDTKKAGEDPESGDPRAVAGPRAPRLGEASEILRGFREEEFPASGEQPPSHLKRGADLVLYTPDGPQKQPLLATWQYGLGRAVAFPFDATQPEAVTWAAWPGFGKLWSQMVRWVIREEAPWETKQTVRFEEGSPFLEVQTFQDVEETTIDAEVFTSPEHATELVLTPVAPRIFRAPLPPLSPGRYGLLLTRRSGDKVVAQKRDVLTIDAATDEAGAAELVRKVPDAELLREITQGTGGSLNPSLDVLTERRGGTQPVRYPLDWMLVPVALAALLGDIAIRRRTLES